MKIRSTLAFIFLIPCVCFSQNYLSGNLSWAYYGESYDGLGNMDKIYYWEYAEGGDSTINSLSYYKISNMEIDSTFLVSNDSFITSYTYSYHPRFLVRENGMLLYCINEYGRDTLLWDFNLSINSEILPTYTTGCGTSYVDSIKSIPFGSSTRQIFYSHTIDYPGGGGPQTNWAFIEGIGTYQGLFNSICGGIGIEGGDELICYSKDGSDFVFTTYYDTAYNLSPYYLLYQNFPCFPPDYSPASVNEISADETIEVFPNPASTYFQIKCSAPNDRSYIFKLYDATGREINQQTIHTTSTIVQRGNLSNGLYFWEMVSNNQIINRGKLALN